MRRLWPLFLFVIIFVIALAADKFKLTPQQAQHNTLQRIISLSPSITETLFALDAGEQLIAVTDYCDFPASANQLPKIGGFINPSLEAITAFQPDLVILLASQQNTVEQLKQLQIPTLAVHNRTLSDIKNTIDQVGKHTGHHVQATQLLSQIDNKIAHIKQKTQGLSKPTVMITMGHSLSSEQLKQIYIAGQHDFYNDLIELSGGQNVYQQDQPHVPSLSVEGIMQLNPDIIIDIFPEADDHNASLSQVQQQWKSLKHITAVKNNRVHIIEENYATIPGPRIFLLLEQLAPLIHPELAW